MKLRKHIRTRRLTAIEQLGCDRCVDLTFGRGENSFHLVLELYVSGNLLLTDHEYRILALLRTHADQQSKVALRHIYPIDQVTGLLSVPIEEFEGALDNLLNVAAQRQENQEIKEIENEDEKARQLSKRGGESAFAKRSKKRVNHSAMPLVQILHKLAPFADPALCASCITKAMTAADIPCLNAFKITVDDLSFEDTVEILQKAAGLVLQTLQSVSRPCDLGGGSMPVLESIEDADDQDLGDDDDNIGDEKADQQDSAEGRIAEVDAPIVPGWITRKRMHVPPTEPYWANEEFTPLQPEPADPEAAVSFKTFHECVDEFYTTLEANRAAEQKAQHAKTVYDKVERIRADQGRRVEQLVSEQEISERQALLIEANVELVERALAMVNTMVASQIDWGELWREVKRQQRLGHPIAQHIHAMDLERNEIQFLLSGSLDGEDEEGEEDMPMEVVPLDLNLTPHANVARLHAKRKETREKTSRTLNHAEVAIKQAERKAQQDLQKFQLKQTIRRVRQNWWFEKYFWFISSENFLVIAGHDAQQTEHIFSKHLGPQDVFVQADVAGARTCFVRNPSGSPVPPATLREAGTMALCHSTAWDKRIVISAWWVPVGQVLRGGSPPQGDCVLVDNFFVQGRRHFMPPLHLEMGIALLFHVGDSSSTRHKGERRSRYLEVMGNEAKDDDAAGGSDSDDDASFGDDVREGKQGAENTMADALARSEVGVAEVDGSTSEREVSLQGNEEEGSEEGEDVDDGNAEHEAVDGEGVGKALRNVAVVERNGQAAAPGTDAVADAKAGRTRISRAERKRLKKDGGADGPADGAASPVAHEKFQPAPRSQDPLGGSPKAAAAKAKAEASKAPLPRGQKAKAKKIKEKYADQDESERQLKLALLGSKETKRFTTQSVSGPAEEGAASADEAVGGAAAAPAPPSASAVFAGDAAPGLRCEKGAGAGGSHSVSAGGASEHGGKRGLADKRPHPRRDQDVRLTAGCQAEDQAPQETQLAQLELLTGQPAAEEEVLYAMPMVAPYCALGGPYTYRAKLTPGPGKKGQVMKQCLKMFETQIDRQAWKLLVQAIPENEATCLMMGTCKASMPGMQKLQQQVRKDSKKEKKERDGGAVAKK